MKLHDRRTEHCMMASSRRDRQSRGQKLRVGRSLIPGKKVRTGLLIGGEGNRGVLTGASNILEVE